MSALEDQFDAAMMRLYIDAKEAGHNATYFLRMLGDIGGVATAKRLISDPSPSEGFTRLWEMGLLNLTVESLAIRPEYREIFTRAEQAAARTRLEQYGHRTS